MSHLKSKIFPEMSRRWDWSRSFRNDSHLRQYFLEGVTPKGKTLGAGSYGSVVEV